MKSISPENTTHESIEHYWFVFGEKLKQAPRGTDEHAVAWRNYMLATYCRVSEEKDRGQSQLINLYQFNKLYSEGLGLTEQIKFNGEDIRMSMRFISAGIREHGHQPGVVSELELLRGLQDGTYEHDLEERHFSSSL